MARHVAGVLGFAVISAVVAFSGAARADVQHTIARGHTLESIANRYHVTVKAIMDANHLKDAKHLHIGDTLTIPGVKDAPGASKAKADHAEKTEKKAEDRDGHAYAYKKSDKTAHLGAPAGRETTSFAMKPKTPGVIHISRIATKETFDVNTGDATRKGRVSPTALKTFEKMMRSPSGMEHPIEPRLVALLGVVSNHFGSRKIEVISGFRPFTPTQYNPHSNHMHGKAVDFRVVGVPNEVVRDFCRTLKNTGCGYYPNSVFVHMDARDQSAFWIDYSKPGEAPRYNAPDSGADEGTSDVAEGPGADAPAAIPAPAEAAAPAPASDYGDTGGN